MKVEDLLTKAKSGDSQALTAWIHTYQSLIFRLVYPAGLAKEKFSRIQLEIAQRISSKLATINEGNAESKILEAAVRILITGDQDYSNDGEDGSIKFEEDLAAHQALQKLAIRDKLAVILTRFHGTSVAEAAAILNESEEIAETAVLDAMDVIRRELALESSADVQKRMDLLGKSYNRIALPEDDDLIIEEIQTIQPAQAAIKKEYKPPVKRRTIAVLAGASLFLAAVIGTSFLFNEQPETLQQTAAEEESPITVTRGMVKNWEAEYEEVRESAPERLGISPDRFEQLEFVQKADALRERTFSRQNVKKMRDDPKRMKEQFDVLMLNIETPKGMLDAVKGDNTLLASEVGNFLVIYTEKTDQLMTIADGLLEQYKEELPKASADDGLAYERLLYNRGNYPEAIVNLTAALREMTLEYAMHPNEERFRTVRDVNPFFAVHPFSSELQSSYYLEILRGAPYFDDTGMLLPVEELSYSIMTMAGFLIEPSVDPILKSKVEPQMTQAFFTMMTGGADFEIFDSDGVVKEEHRMIWESMLQLDINPLTYVLLPILEEFEESGWTESAHFDKLALPTILDAIEMEESGELAAKLPNGDLVIDSEIFIVQNYDYSDVQSLYDKFSQSYDEGILSGIEPLEIVKLYYYANKIEDSEMMWHLTADDQLRPSLEEYLVTWEKLPELTEEYRQLEVYGGNNQRQGRKVLLMVMGTKKEYDDNYYNNLPFTLITERDHVWKMQHDIDEFHSIEDDFTEYNQNVQNQYNELVQTGDRDSLLSASPAETAGIFLLALEKEDIQTMRMLLNDDDVPIDDEEFKNRWMSGQFPVYSEMEGISFRADTYNLNVIGMTGSADVINNIETMEETHYMPMEKVGETWMIGDMFDY